MIRGHVVSKAGLNMSFQQDDPTPCLIKCLRTKECVGAEVLRHMILPTLYFTYTFPPTTLAVALSCRLSIHIKMNCTTYEYKNRNCVRRLFWERATVCMPLPAGVVEEESGRRTYLRERSWTLLSTYVRLEEGMIER